MKGPYDDIIHLPHHVSSRHPQMSVMDRAAQFSPFSALAGYSAAIQETARLTTEKVNLEEDGREMLNRKLQLLSDWADVHPVVEIVYFRPDGKKAGGAYVQATGALKQVEEYEPALLLMDGTRIPIENILEIQCREFEE